MRREMIETIKYIWTERHRPSKVKDVVGDAKNKILKYLENPQQMPHFLFCSTTPGTGKTTMAKCIINELGCDSLIINSSDDRKIETIREKIKAFSMTQSSKKGLRRLVFLDEFDGMLKASQNALRNLMETYSNNVIFILTANNINKIIEPLKSRCVIISFAYPEKTEIYKYLEMICNKENLNYSEGGLNKLIDINFPSIRNCVISLQDLWTEKKDVTEQTVHPVNEIFNVLYNHLKEKNWQEIKKVVLESTIDARELNTFFWNKGLNEENIKLIQICCRNEKDISWGANANIVFVTSLIEACK
jgi:DNA polymerase III delta prime subunit